MNQIAQRARQNVIDMQAYKSARSQFSAEDQMVFLDANECAFEPYIGASGLSHYSDQQPKDLVDAMCRVYDVASKNLLITRGADEAILVLIQTFCDPNKDSIIITPPTFPMYAQSALLQQATIQEVGLNDDFSLNVEAVIAAKNPQTKIVFLCAPNNPTGSMISQVELEQICQAYAGHAIVAMDEAYVEFSGQPSATALLEKYDNLLVLRTLSKAYAAAGIRCGAALAHSDVIALMRKVLPPYPLPSPVVREALQILAPQNLKRLKSLRAETMDVKAWFEAQAEKLEAVVEVLPSQANFSLIKFKDAQYINSQALAAGFVLRPQSHKALENCIRLSIGTREDMQKLLDVFAGKPFDAPKNQRIASVTRNTKETRISVKVNLDETSPIRISTGIGFYDHMLEALAKHGGFSLELECAGDLEIDMHHTVEDCAIALGQALKKALGDKIGIGRYGFTLPMDESQASASIDLSGRYFLKFDADFPDKYVGELPVDMVEHVFRSLAENLQCNLHIQTIGDNTHHMVEAAFKAVARSLRQAIRVEGTDLPSTKGVL